ncbi:MAG: DMT family transporter [Arenimonas sp.]
MPSESGRLSGRELGLVALICLAWAGNFITSKLALEDFPPFLFTALRLLLLTLLLGAFLKLPPRAVWPRLLAVALFNGVLHFALSFWSLKLSHNIASPAIVMQSYVPMVALLAWWLLGEKFHWRTGTAIAVSFLGVLVLGFDPAMLADPLPLGLMLVSALFIALGTIAMRGLQMDLIQQQGWTAAIGLIPIWLISVLVEGNPLAHIQNAGMQAWIGVFYAALIASLVGHGLFFVLIKRHPVAMITPYLLTAPLLAAILGVVLLGDHVGIRVWIGGAMVLSGVFDVALRNLQKAKPEPPVAADLV